MIKLTKKQIALYQTWFDLDYRILCHQPINADSKEKMDNLIVARERARMNAVEGGVPGIK